MSAKESCTSSCPAFLADSDEACCAHDDFAIHRRICDDDEEIPLTEWLRVLHYEEPEEEDNLVALQLQLKL